MRARLMNNTEHPLTQDETKLIRSGDLVQLHNGKNTLWSQVADVKTRGYFDGIVSSRCFSTAYTFGDLIRFHRRHIQGFSIA